MYGHVICVAMVEIIHVYRAVFVMVCHQGEFVGAHGHVICVTMVVKIELY